MDSRVFIYIVLPKQSFKEREEHILIFEDHMCYNICRKGVQLKRKLGLETMNTAGSKPSILVESVSN